MLQLSGSLPARHANGGPHALDSSRVGKIQAKADSPVSTTPAKNQRDVQPRRNPRSLQATPNAVGTNGLLSKPASCVRTTTRQSATQKSTFTLTVLGLGRETPIGRAGLKFGTNVLRGPGGSLLLANSGEMAASRLRRAAEGGCRRPSERSIDHWFLETALPLDCLDFTTSFRVLSPSFYGFGINPFPKIDQRLIKEIAEEVVPCDQ